MTTEQIVLLLVLIAGIATFFGIGIWGIHRLRDAEGGHDVHRHS